MRWGGWNVNPNIAPAHFFPQSFGYRQLAAQFARRGPQGRSIDIFRFFAHGGLFRCYEKWI